MRDSALTVGDFNRNGVLIIGDFPIDTTSFAQRNLSTKTVTIETAKEFFGASKVIVVVDYPGKYNLIKKCFKRLFDEADNHGIAQIVLFHNDADFYIIDQLQKKEFSNPRNYSSKPIKNLIDVAEFIARYSAGPSLPEDIEIEGDVSEIDEEEKLLLCRSFYDCKKIHVEPISGGRDSRHLFKVHAWQANSEVKSSLVPFFVKIASHDKIDEELEKYKVFTDLYISFQFRPNCRIERCAQTKNYKSLVGNFVEDSISLRKALQDTHHTGVIFSLFEKSLRGFRRQPFTVIGSDKFQAFIDARIQINKLQLNNDVLAKARELGLISDVNQMYKRLMSNCPESYLSGIIHGDLHSGNVMVIANDAIVIDFSAVTYGPLTADPVALEISLSFNAGEKNHPKFEKWKEFIDEVYNPKQVTRPLGFTESVPNEFFWLRRSIREIRHVLIGCDCAHDEIKVIMACYLMRIARLTPIKRAGKKEEFEFAYHSYALVVAERIINSLGEKTTG
ncbi:MAG: hypothetical protein OJF59_000827 [Cytophagales bacterium]|jgi:thiamine kinase-like enzyme|nr:MAG: hypothetical protein OJF59_000827 [Cytophagales bacterium]